MSNRAQDLASRFHEAYERLAPSFGYETRAESRTFNPESPNGRLMTAVCAEILGAGLPPSDALQALKDAGAQVYGGGWIDHAGECTALPCSCGLHDWIVRNSKLLGLDVTHWRAAVTKESPPPPDVLASALQEKVHSDLPGARAATAVRAHETTTARCDDCGATSKADAPAACSTDGCPFVAAMSEPGSH